MSAALRVKVKEKPILFSGPMIRAILEGRKTQTRRVITDERIKVFTPGYADDRERIIGMCPYGRVGDRLWVRETWMPKNWDSDREYMLAGCLDAKQHPTETYLDSPTRAIYAASYNTRIGDAGKWSPSIFMPRWASRITLEITNIRVERLQEISEADIRAEGINEAVCASLGESAHRDPDLLEAWCHGWDNLNAKRGYSWESNPLVWVIEFRKL